MTSKSARHPNPRSISEAMELCLRHARTKRNLSVEGIADRMGLSNHWALYKWMENGRLPSVLIRPFESACGAEHVSRFIAHSAGNLLVRMPNGKKADVKELAALQGLLTSVLSMLLSHRDGEASAHETLASLVRGMEVLAFQHGQIEKADTPELEFGAAE